MMPLFKPTKGKIIVTALSVTAMLLTFYKVGIIYNALFTLETLDYVIFGFDIIIMTVLTYIFTSMGFHYMKIKW